MSVQAGMMLRFLVVISHLVDVAKTGIFRNSLLVYIQIYLF